MEYQSIQDKQKWITHDCIIAVDELDNALLLKSSPSLYDNDIFDGNYLVDNGIDKKDIPCEFGVYRCKILVYAYSSFDGETTEHDLDISIKDVEKILYF